MTPAPVEPPPLPGGLVSTGSSAVARSSSLGRLAFWSTASALAAVVPVPFLDDHLVRVTRRSLVRELGRERGLGLGENEVRLLAGGPGKGLGCTFGLLIAIAVKGAWMVVRRVFRSIFFWLAIRDAANAASFTFHEGFLLRRALADLAPGAASGSATAPPPRAEVERLRACVEQVIAEVDPRPLTQAFRRTLRGSYRLFHGAVRRLRHLLLGIREEQAEAQTLEQVVPPTLVERLANALDAQGPYLADLTRRIERALAARPPAPIVATDLAPARPDTATASHPTEGSADHPGEPT